MKFISATLLNQLQATRYLKREKRFIFTKSRSSTVTKRFLKKYILVYNGLVYKKVFITPSRIGHKLGEFSFTKKIGREIHNTKKNLKKKKKKK